MTDERRAEIEAVARALHELDRPSWPRRWGWTEVTEESKEPYRAQARTAVEALDRVRDAQGDDEVLPEPQSVKDYKAMVRTAGLRALIPYVHRQAGFAVHNCAFERCQIEGCPTLRSLLARSPQGCARENCFVPDTGCVMGFDAESCPHRRSPQGVERMDDPHRARWFELCRSLTPDQTDVLREGLERRARRAFESGREAARSPQCEDHEADEKQEAR